MLKLLGVISVLCAALAEAGLIAGHGAAYACSPDRTPAAVGLVADQVATADLIVVGVVAEKTVVG